MGNNARSKPFVVAEYLSTPELAAEYLNAAIEDGDERVLLKALRDVAQAGGGMHRLSEDTGLAREAIYRMLSEQGNPRLSSLVAVLHGLGLDLAVKPMKDETNREPEAV